MKNIYSSYLDDFYFSSESHINSCLPKGLFYKSLMHATMFQLYRSRPIHAPPFGHALFLSENFYINIKTAYNLEEMLLLQAD